MGGNCWYWMDYPPPYSPLSGEFIIKIKDYLLADIEIEEIAVDGNPIDLSSISGISGYYDEQTGKYKPYRKYGKDFSTTRQCNGETLNPGEFVFCIPLKYLSGKNKFTVTIKNTTGKTAECTIYIPSPVHYAQGKKGSEKSNTSCKHYDDVKDNEAERSAAYNNFLGAPE